MSDGQARGQNGHAVADAAATAITLNYALGNLGGRQKAWMAAGLPPTPPAGPTSPLRQRRRSRPQAQPSREQPHTTQPQIITQQLQAPLNPTSVHSRKPTSSLPNSNVSTTSTAGLLSPSLSDDIVVGQSSTPGGQIAGSHHSVQLDRAPSPNVNDKTLPTSHPINDNSVSGWEVITVGRKRRAEALEISTEINSPGNTFDHRPPQCPPVLLSSHSNYHSSESLQQTPVTHMQHTNPPNLPFQASTQTTLAHQNNRFYATCPPPAESSSTQELPSGQQQDGNSGSLCWTPGHQRVPQIGSNAQPSQPPQGTSDWQPLQSRHHVNYQQPLSSPQTVTPQQTLQSPQATYHQHLRPSPYTVHPEQMVQSPYDASNQQSLQHLPSENFAQPLQSPQDGSHHHMLQAAHPSSSTSISAAAVPMWYTKQDCELSLLSFFSVHKPPAQSLDSVRLCLLKNAVESSDWAYLIMHQYFCLADVDPAGLVEFDRNHPSRRPAMELMQLLLDKNENLLPSTLRFFAYFPMSLPNLVLKYPKGFRRETHSLCQFISYSVNWPHVQAICRARFFPITVRELVGDLGIISMVFQRVVFTSTLRHIWATVSPLKPPSELEREGTDILARNQVDYRQRRLQRAAQSGADVVNEVQEREMEFHLWGSLLQKLCHPYRSNGAVHPVNAQQPPPTGTVPQQHLQQPAMSSSEYVYQNSTTGVIPQQHPQSQIVHSDSQAVRMASGPTAPTSRSRLRGHPRLQRSIQRPVHVSGVLGPTSLAPLRTAPAAVLPPSGFVQPRFHQAEPARYGLHLAGLRSPVLRSTNAKTVLYTYVDGFLMQPFHLDTTGLRPLRTTFTVDANQLTCIPKEQAGIVGAPPDRFVDDRSQLLLLRSVRWADATEPSADQWVSTRTSWTKYAYISLNAINLEQRRELHHGKDLAIDISSTVRSGENVLQFDVLGSLKEATGPSYWIAIERVSVARHASIIEICNRQNRLEASEVKMAIQARLSDTMDEDIIIVEPNLTINTFDPFSNSKMCDTPVRSRTCTHFDCFDLETYLQTRKGTHNVKTGPWKCPICNVDARPHKLIVDGFMQEVYDVLRSQGAFKARAIVVDKDGSWRPKVEVVEGVADHDYDPDFPDEGTGPGPSSQVVPPDAEVIDLSD